MPYQIKYEKEGKIYKYGYAKMRIKLTTRHNNITSDVPKQFKRSIREKALDLVQSYTCWNKVVHCLQKYNKKKRRKYQEEFTNP